MLAVARASAREDARVGLGWVIDDSEEHLVQEVLAVVVDRRSEPKAVITLDEVCS